MGIGTLSNGHVEGGSSGLKILVSDITEAMKTDDQKNVEGCQKTAFYSLDPL